MPGKIIDPDGELLRRIARGDDDAFRVLFERHYRLAYSVIYRHIGLQAAAEDLVQEAFLRVYRNAAKWEPSAKFSTWFYTIVSNLCLNYKRDRARDRLRLVSPDQDGGNPLEQIAGADDPPHDDSDERARKAALIRAALDELPENQRMALILSKYENKDYEEIAKILGTTVAAVKSMTARARVTLREKLKRHFHDL
ncbi:MAG: sigma-70 family RNA polymerase sigma factor [Planctomycetes bacterium]|jgi:RNA polymerase sigma-70 factor (ECF subfamily)|nr:sigma-70 family RNA polymerase sigma factor [Planctomycetota bacterium]MCL4730954.1 sigma-70 family RNA polymerase sigma factor [Planctomycetota bacterium]